VKVKVSFTLEVDVEGWMRDYGLLKEDVREDVQSWARTQLQEANENVEVVR
jgi:hypothetical protein